MARLTPSFPKSGKRNSPLASQANSHLADAVPLKLLQDGIEEWLMAGQARPWSDSTLEGRRLVTSKLLWLLQERGHTHCGPKQIREFIAHAAKPGPGGRWGDPSKTQPLRPQTLNDYYVVVRTLFRWMVKEEMIASAPTDKVDPPAFQQEKIAPFTEEQAEALLAAARKSRYPLRDEAIVSLMLDTGARASEVCGLRVCDVDFKTQHVTVLGKGNKYRRIPFGLAAKQALYRYLSHEETTPEDYVFVGERGRNSGAPMLRNGLGELIARLGKQAKITGVRCSPHTCRHTFAVCFLRNGGNSFSLMELLGHTNIKMTNRYVALVQADVDAQHRAFSPMDKIKGLRRRK